MDLLSGQEGMSLLLSISDRSYVSIIKIFPPRDAPRRSRVPAPHYQGVECPSLSSAAVPLFVNFIGGLDTESGRPQLSKPKVCKLVLFRVVAGGMICLPPSLIFFFFVFLCVFHAFSVMGGLAPQGEASAEQVNRLAKMRPLKTYEKIRNTSRQGAA